MTEPVETEEYSPRHAPVMPQEVLEWLAPQPGDIYLDGTLGLGGHARLVAEKIGANGALIGLDRDDDALAVAAERLKDAPCRVKLVKSRYAEMISASESVGIAGVDRILLDLGVSSLQLDKAERGFSFMRPGPLDMRMGQAESLTAQELVMTLPEEKLARIIYEYGEERFSRRIAKSIVETRAKETINTTDRLAEIVANAQPGRGKIHPATRTFQALRMAVNDELGELETGLQAAVKLLNPGGRLVVITFHSLEDRLAKNVLRTMAEDNMITLPKKKVVKPSRAECLVNKRARSAKLRVAEKL